MKCLSKLLLLTLTACSARPSAKLENYDNAVSARANHKILAIDSAIHQLDYEYEKANNAISVNEAEKVYLQRFEKDLLMRRNAICREALKI